MTEPIQASEVRVESNAVDQEQIEKAKIKRAVSAHRAKREALKRSGLTGAGSAALQTDLERRMDSIVSGSTRAFRARKAAEEAVANKRKGK